jgi:hypothetical protein
MKKIILRLATLSLASSVLLAQSSTTLSVGGTYSDGKYGTENSSSSIYIPVTATYKNSMFEMAVTVPYIELDSEGSFTWTPGGPVPISSGKSTDSLTSNSLTDPLASTDTNTTKTKTSGLGDINVKVGYTFVPTKGLYLKTSAIMKVATADKDKGLGTGENDYSAQLDIYKILGSAYIYLSGGYTLMGDSNTTDYSDTAYGSAALGYNFTPALSTGINYAFREAIFDTLDDTQSTSVYMSYKPSKSFKIATSYTYGLSDSTADNAYTLTLSKTF